MWLVVSFRFLPFLSLYLVPFILPFHAVFLLFCFLNFLLPFLSLCNLNSFFVSFYLVLLFLSRCDYLSSLILPSFSRIPSSSFVFFTVYLCNHSCSHLQMTAVLFPRVTNKQRDRSAGSHRFVTIVHFSTDVGRISRPAGRDP